MITPSKICGFLFKLALSPGWNLAIRTVNRLELPLSRTSLNTNLVLTVLARLFFCFMAAQLPDNEVERLQRLRDYNILDSLDEEDFDSITRLAASICETPISLISLIDEDRQWFKSKVGMEERETHRSASFCAHAILEPDNIFLVKDAKRDERFKENPLVLGAPKIQFYMGVPLVDKDGLALGTLCIIDRKPHTLNENQVQLLKVLSKQVMRLIELRYQNRKLTELAEQLDEKNEELHQFAITLSHDIKSPIVGIQMLIQLLKNKSSFDPESKEMEYMSLLETTIEGLQGLVSEVLNYYRLAENEQEEFDTIEIESFVKEIAGLQLGEDAGLVEIETDIDKLRVKPVTLKIILSNLIDNAYRYNTNEDLIISLYM